MTAWIMNGVPAAGNTSMPSGGVSFVGQFLSIQCPVIHPFTTRAGQAVGLPLLGPPKLVSAVGGSTSAPALIGGSTSAPIRIGN